MSSSRAARRLPVVLAALVAAPLLLGACGSSSNTTATELTPATTAPSGTAGGDSAGTTTTEPDDDRTTTTTKKKTTVTKDDATTTTKKKTETTGAVTDPDWADFCALGEKYDKEFEGIEPDDPSLMPQFQAAFQELTDAAPAELQADMKIVNDYMQSLTSIDEFLAAPQEVQDASDRVDAIADEKCGTS